MDNPKAARNTPFQKNVVVCSVCLLSILLSRASPAPRATAAEARLPKSPRFERREIQLTHGFCDAPRIAGGPWHPDQLQNAACANDLGTEQGVFHQRTNPIISPRCEFPTLLNGQPDEVHDTPPLVYPVSLGPVYGQRVKSRPM